MSTGLSYEDAIELDDVTPEDARHEINKHCFSEQEQEEKWAEFLAEVGEKEFYTGDEVLGFLGY